MFKKQHKNANLVELHNNCVHTFAGMWNELVRQLLGIRRERRAKKLDGGG